MPTQTLNAELSELYQRLMVDNQKAFDLEKYGIAYHVLTAALHCQDTLQDAQSLSDIEQRAGEQLA